MCWLVQLTTDALVEFRIKHDWVADIQDSLEQVEADWVGFTVSIFFQLSADKDVLVQNEPLGHLDRFSA